MKYKKSSEIKAILFDIGGVLQVPKLFVRLIQDSHLAGVPSNCGHRNRSIHEYLANKFKILIDQWFDAIDTTYAKSIEGNLPEEKVVQIISSNLGVSQKRFEKFVIKAFKKNFVLNKQLFKQAKILKKRGYKIAILSDQWHLSKKSLMPKSLTNHFFPVIVSCDVGMRKPNPKIYELTIKKLKLKPSEVLFIDNQEWNLRPARKLGMKTIKFTDNGQLFSNKTWKTLFKQPV
ncbi:MAG: HAD family phosphatase [Nanoarchaeota archaeon]|nr:HAD family phosphatase [Nanoarchaeota archaeon]